MQQIKPSKPFAAKFLILFGAAAVSIAALSGCEQVPSHTGVSLTAPSTGGPAITPSADAAPQPADANSPQPQQGATVYVYKLAQGSGKADANGLEAVPIRMPLGAVDAAKVSLQELAEGSNSPLPAGTKVLGVVIDPATKLASVNFSRELKSNFHGGETEEAQVINSVLQTLGQFASIDKVQFLIDGKPLDTLGGAQDLSQPLPTPQSTLSGANSGEFTGSGAKQ